MATVNTSETLKNKCLPQKSNNISTKGEENHLGNGEMLDNDLCLDLTTTSNSITTEGPKWHTPDKGPENNYFNCSKTSNKNDYCKNIRSHISEEKTIEQAEGPYVTEFRSPYMNHQMIHSWETFSKYDLGPYQWSSKSRMTDHMKSHSNINQFPYGDAKLIEKETEGVADPSLNRPKKRRQKYSAKERKCSYCFATFTNSDLYWAHYKTHLINKKIFACRHCAFVTEYKHHFTYHIQQHKGIKPFKCNQCSYEGISKSMLISHLRLHSVVHQYRCDDCDFGGKYIRQLLSHLKKTGHKPGQFLKPDGTPDDRKCLKVYREDNKLKLCIRFKGEESESGFKSDEGTKDVVSGNMATVHLPNNSETLKKSNDKSNIGEVNEKILDNEIISKETKKPKNKKCVHCLEIFSDMDDYWKHIRTHMSKETMIECSECLFVTEYKRHYNYHKKFHSGKMYKCDQCPYQCPIKQRMTDHMKSHLNFRQFHCDDCDFNVKYIRQLQLHSQKTGHSFSQSNATLDKLDKRKDVDVSGDHKGTIETENIKSEQIFEVDDPKFIDILYPEVILTVNEDVTLEFNGSLENKSYKTCDFCNFQFNKNGDTHMSYHKKNDPFICNECDYNCVNSTGFYCHLITKHQIAN